MPLKIYSEPSVEPVSLSEIKTFLRLDSGSFSDTIDSTQSIAPGLKAIANNYTTHVGSGVNVLGYQALVVLSAGTNGATGTVDVKIQESDDNVTYIDWTGGAFDQVTTATDNATYEKNYTGSKLYIRAVAKVLLATCEFGVSIIRNLSVTTEDELLTELIKAARHEVEQHLGRKIITQTWDYTFYSFPTNKDYISLPWGGLQSVTHVKYKNSSGTETTMTENTQYIVAANGNDANGLIFLPENVSWPDFTPYPHNAVTIRFVCGYGDSAASVPSEIKTVIKMIVADLYANRGESIVGNNFYEDPAIRRMLNLNKLYVMI